MAGDLRSIHQGARTRAALTQRGLFAGFDHAAEVRRRFLEREERRRQQEELLARYDWRALGVSLWEIAIVLGLVALCGWALSVAVEVLGTL